MTIKRLKANLNHFQKGNLLTNHDLQFALYRHCGSIVQLTTDRKLSILPRMVRIQC